MTHEQGVIGSVVWSSCLAKKGSALAEPIRGSRG